MKKVKEFPFDRARRVTSEEVKKAHSAIEDSLGKKRASRGRPPKSSADKYLPVSIRLHPKVMSWVKKEAKKKGTGYQSLINDILLKFVA